MSRSGREKQGDAHASGAGYANGRNLSEVFGEVGNDGDITDELGTGVRELGPGAM